MVTNLQQEKRRRADVLRGARDAMSTPATITDILRYPVKGLSADRLDRITLTPGETLPFDRSWAIENGPSKFDAAAPKHLPKIAFLMLMRNERLAALAASFDAASRTLTIRLDGAIVAEGRLDEPGGRAALEEFFAGYAAENLRGRPRIVSAPGHSFSDTNAKCLSLINLETVRDIERTLGLGPVHPLRFRGNLYVDGMPAWSEFDWLGKSVRAGGATLEAYARIDRCAATNVNPETAKRDMALPLGLLKAYDHPDCGIYLRVTAPGEIATGDPIAPAGD
jgi:uncharacterized protein YcbX